MKRRHRNRQPLHENSGLAEKIKRLECEVAALGDAAKFLGSLHDPRPTGFVIRIEAHLARPEIDEIPF